MTSRVSIRTWFDPRVRFWVVVAGFLFLLFVYFSLARGMEWRQESELILHGTLVSAKVGTAGVDRSGYVVPPATPVTLSFNFQDKPQQVEGLLEGHTARVSTGESIQIRIDPDDPTRWTDLSEPRPLIGNLIGPTLLLPIVPVALLVAWLKRRRLIYSWMAGPVETAVIAKKHQTALAPMAHVVKCSFRDREDKRLFVTYLPRHFSAHKPGDVIWLIASPHKNGPAIAARVVGVTGDFGLRVRDHVFVFRSKIQNPQSKMALVWSDMSMFKRLALATVGRTPAGVRAWVYRHPTIWNFLAGMIGRMVPAGESTVVDVRVGPNAGLKLAIDQTTPRYYWLDPNYESAVVGVLNEWTKPGMRVADIGAHIGFMTMVLSRRVGANGQILSVEPSPPSVAQLRRNVELNHLTNVKVIQVAISDSTGEAQFSILPFATTSHIVSGLGENSEAGATMVSVPLTRLDDLVFGPGGSGGIDVVKIDVEGHEGAVLRGASRVIRELRPKLLIEIHTASALADCLKQLSDARYEISTVTGDEYYARAIADPAIAERDGALFSINHLRCLPL